MSQTQHKMPIYMDYSATTPIDPRVAQVMIPYLTEHFGNPAIDLHDFLGLDIYHCLRFVGLLHNGLITGLAGADCICRLLSLDRHRHLRGDDRQNFNISGLK